MAELQRQIGDHARAAAEASPRSTVGDVIQPGQPIPDDVTWVTDTAGDQQQRGDDGLWHQGGVGNDPVPWPGEKLMGWAPFTVIAVREQPAEPVEGFPGRTFREQREAYEQPAEPSLLVNLEDMQCPDEGNHIAHGWWALNGRAYSCPGFVGRAGVPAEPEPQQADEPALLDLVRQYGAERQRMGSASITGSAPAVHEHKTRAAALLARIAALVPQQPVQARSATNSLLWVHTCGWTRSWDVQPYEDDCPSCGNSSPGPWRPLLVGGDPVPQQPDLMAQVMAELGVDKPEDVLERLSWLKRRVGEQGREFVVATAEAEHYLKERDEARAEVERLKTERDAWIEQARQAGIKLEQFKAAAPVHDGVLRLPEVPEGTVALVGVRSGRRYPFHEESGGWRNDDGEGAPWKLSAVLHREQPEGVRVELAPPREPRTAAEIWASMTPEARLMSRDQVELAEALDREAGL